MCFWLHFLHIILIRHPSRSGRRTAATSTRHTPYENGIWIQQPAEPAAAAHKTTNSILIILAKVPWQRLRFTIRCLFLCVRVSVCMRIVFRDQTLWRSHFLHSKTILLKFSSGTNLSGGSTLCAPNRTRRRTYKNPQTQTASIKIYYLFVSVCLSLIIIIIVILIVLHHFIVRVFTLRHAANVPTVYSSGYNVHIFVNVFYWRRRILIHNFHLLLLRIATSTAAAMMCVASPDERTFRASI